MEDLDEIKKLLTDNEVNVDAANVLFLDISSSCTGYCKVAVDFINKKANIKSAGALWLDPNWDHQEKFSYMFNAIMTYFEVVEQVDHIVYEHYSVNPKKAMGCMVVSEMVGAIKVGAAENGVKVTSIYPQQWRSELGIKPDTSQGKRDYKEPTKQKVLQVLNVPNEIISNITKNNRQTPNDLYDAIAVSLGWLKRLGIKKIDYSNCTFNPHIGVL